ncbi:hypothetical protein [Gordonia terrae]|uniref:hypothetical protein n=1 Tax=Gordonia terrae TaxID=2055 RepID=UPI003F6D4373
MPGVIMAGVIMAGVIMAGVIMAGVIMAGVIMAGVIMAGVIMAGVTVFGSMGPGVLMVMSRGRHHRGRMLVLWFHEFEDIPPWGIYTSTTGTRYGYRFDKPGRNMERPPHRPEGPVPTGPGRDAGAG